VRFVFENKHGWKHKTMSRLDYDNYIYYKCQDYSDTVAKICCRGTVQNVVSKFAVNAMQQIDSAIMSGHQRMP